MPISAEKRKVINEKTKLQLVHDPIKRKEMTERNKIKILSFLAFHRYSNLELITLALGLKSKSVASRILKKLCFESYVSKGIIKDEISRVTLFGITKKGIKKFNLKATNPFLKSKVSLRTLAHKLSIQRGHIYLNKKLKNLGLNPEFSLPDYKKVELVNSFRSDLVCLFFDKLNYENKILIEAELSIKSYQRYIKLFDYFYVLKKRKQITKVIYLVPNETKKKKIEGFMEDFGIQMKLNTLNDFTTLFQVEIISDLQY